MYAPQQIIINYRGLIFLHAKHAYMYMYIERFMAVSKNDKKSKG